MSQDQRPWPVVAMEHSRLLRPFSARRLTDALYHVEATAGSIHAAHQRLLIDPTSDPGEWTFELGQLQCLLESLADYCEDAWLRLDVLARSAHGDYERAVDAMAAILRGLNDPPGEVVEAPAKVAA